MRIRLAAAAVVVAGLLAACSSTADPADATPGGVVTGGSGGGASVEPSEVPAGTPQMTALCAQMVDERLGIDDATALAEQNGYVARIGMVDGEPRALTMDFNENRFTFDVADGAVVGCTYG